jgi:hypothetical protein
MASSSSSGRTPLPRLATLADLLSIDEEDRFHEALGLPVGALFGDDLT